MPYRTIIIILIPVTVAGLACGVHWLRTDCTFTGILTAIFMLTIMVGVAVSNQKFYCSTCEKICYERYCLTCGWEAGTKKPDEYCSECGKKNEKGALFCGNCGTPTALEESQ